MYFEISRKELLTPLKMVVSVVEQRQTLPILGNILVSVRDNTLHLTATDSEVEIICSIPLESSLQTEEAETTIPRKFFDIVRSLPDASEIQMTGEDNHLVLKSGKSRFSLSTLPAEDFPALTEIENPVEFRVPQGKFRELLQKTAFCIAANDVRYYLMGLLLEIREGKMFLVGTDGHRMAVAQHEFETEQVAKVIVPRKAVLELLKLLPASDEEMVITCNEHHIKFQINDSLVMNSKLIDGNFPDWQGVVPLHADKIVLAETAALKQALSRVSILSNEKYKGVRLTITDNLLIVNAKNPQQEEATEELAVDYQGDELEVGFNGVYLLDALNVVSTSQVQLAFTDPSSSVLLTHEDSEDFKWIIMPMRL